MKTLYGGEKSCLTFHANVFEIRCLPEPSDYDAYIYCYLEEHR